MQKFNTMGQLLLLLALAAPAVSFGQGTEVTFHEDIEPILQRSCQSCHRDGGCRPNAPNKLRSGSTFRWFD